MSLVWKLFFLPWVFYLAGAILARLGPSLVPALASWLKGVQHKNTGTSLFILTQPYHRRAWNILVGNLIFGLLIVVSGLLLGLPPLFLIFRSSFMSWGITADSKVANQLNRVRLHYRFIAFTEGLLFMLWASLGVEIGLAVFALLTARRDILAEQSVWLPALPWLVSGMLLTLVVCALVEAHMLGFFKDKVIQAFFHRPAETPEHQVTAPAEERLAS